MRAGSEPRPRGRREAARPSRVPPPYPGSPRLIVGFQPVREAVRAGAGRLGAVLVQEGSATDAERLDALVRFATDQGVTRVLRVGRSELDRLAGGAPHQGAAAWAPELVLVDAVDVLAAPDLLAVALDSIQDPQNFGAVVRSAVGLGASAVVWPENASAPLSPATFRASAGAVEHARLCRVPSLVRFLDEAIAAGAQVVGLAPDAPAAFHRIDLRPPTVLVIGSEHEGLGRAVRRRCTALGRLTLRGRVESLNASAACAAALYVALMQRSP